MTEIEAIEVVSKMLGYRVVTDADGTIRYYRPDGTLAVTVKKTK